MRGFKSTPAVPLALRTARVLLALHCAGKRGIGFRDLLRQSGTSKASLYRDLGRIKDAGWRLRVTLDPAGQVPAGESLATYSLESWQRLPRLAELAIPSSRPASRSADRAGKKSTAVYTGSIDSLSRESILRP